MRKSKFLSLLLALAVMTTMLLVPPPATVLAAVDNAVPGTIYGAADLDTGATAITSYDLSKVDQASRARYENDLGNPFGELNGFTTDNNKLNKSTKKESALTYNISKAGIYYFYMLCFEWNNGYPNVTLDSELKYDGSKVSGLSYSPYNLGKVNNYSLTCIQVPAFNLESGQHTINLGTSTQGLIAVVLIESQKPEILFDSYSGTVITNESTTLNATLSGIDNDSNIKWNINPSDVAEFDSETTTVADGKTSVNITAKKSGTAKITAEYSGIDGNTTKSSEYTLTVRDRDHGKVITLDGMSTMLTVGEDSVGDYGQNVKSHSLFGLDVFRTDGLIENPKVTLGNIDLTNTAYDTVEVYGANNSGTATNIEVKVGEQTAAKIEFTSDTEETYKAVSANLSGDAKTGGDVTLNITKSAGNDGNYVYVRFYNSKAPTQSADWKNLSPDGQAGYFTSATEETEGEYSLAIGTNYANKGFSYDLKNKLLSDKTLSDGVIEVSMDIQITDGSSMATNSNFFVDISTDRTIGSWSGAGNTTYARLVANQAWGNVRYHDNKTRTTEPNVNGPQKVTNDYKKLTFRLDLKNKKIYMGYDEALQYVGELSTTPTNALYLNVQPGDGVNSKTCVTKIKNITATYKDASTAEAPVFEQGGTDTGYYTVDNKPEGTQYGVIRFLQPVTGSEITEYGFYFLDNNANLVKMEKHIKGKEDFTADNTGIYADLTEIPKDNWTSKYHAKAYVYIEGNIYFAEQIEGEVGSEPVWVVDPSTEQQ